MKLFFSKTALEEYNLLKSDAPEVVETVKSLLQDILAHPEEGIGTPTKLEGVYDGLWMRVYAPGKVVIYSFGESGVTIISIGVKEAALGKIKLQSYSPEEESSVMAQMAANRGKDAEPKVGIFWYNRARNQSWR
ncbi:MAG: type II toxin-antitoxin system YoeB family toxin [Bacteroidales bacterium]|nr:type II toxin-antitoxin system YoeB family toxin [Bacteroidales bacterium]